MLGRALAHAMLCRARSASECGLGVSAAAAQRSPSEAKARIVLSYADCVHAKASLTHVGAGGTLGGAATLALHEANKAKCTDAPASEQEACPCSLVSDAVRRAARFADDAIAAVVALVEAGVVDLPRGNNTAAALSATAASVDALAKCGFETGGFVNVPPPSPPKAGGDGTSGAASPTARPPPPPPPAPRPIDAHRTRALVVRTIAGALVATLPAGDTAPAAARSGIAGADAATLAEAIKAAPGRDLRDLLHWVHALVFGISSAGSVSSDARRQLMELYNAVRHAARCNGVSARGCGLIAVIGRATGEEVVQAPKLASSRPAGGGGRRKGAGAGVVGGGPGGRPSARAAVFGPPEDSDVDESTDEADEAPPAGLSAQHTHGEERVLRCRAIGAVLQHIARATGSVGGRTTGTPNPCPVACWCAPFRAAYHLVRCVLHVRRKVAAAIAAAPPQHRALEGRAPPSRRKRDRADAGHAGAGAGGPAGKVRYGRARGESMGREDDGGDGSCSGSGSAASDDEDGARRAAKQRRRSSRLARGVAPGLAGGPSVDDADQDALSFGAGLPTPPWVTGSGGGGGGGPRGLEPMSAGLRTPRAAAAGTSSALTAARDVGSLEGYAASLCECMSGDQLRAHIVAARSPWMVAPGVALLDKVATDPRAFAFLEPIDPKSLAVQAYAAHHNLPPYRSVIRHPMDMATLRTYLTKGLLNSPDEFWQLWCLIFDNAMKYNPPTVPLYQDAVEIRALVTHLWTHEFVPAYRAAIAAVEATPMDSTTHCGVCGREGKEEAGASRLRCAVPDCSSVIDVGRRYWALQLPDQGMAAVCGRCNPLPASRRASGPRSRPRGPRKAAEELLSAAVGGKVTETQHKAEEVGWVQCDSCDRWCHTVCGGFNAFTAPAAAAQGETLPFVCPMCLLHAREAERPGAAPASMASPRLRRLLGAAAPSTPNKQSAVTASTKASGGAGGAKGSAKGALTSSDCPRVDVRKMPRRVVVRAEHLPTTPLSTHIEGVLHRQFPDTHGLVVREVSALNGETPVPPVLRKVRVPNGPPALPHRARTLALFQSRGGADICLLIVFVYEYGSDSATLGPNARSAYISYLDSVKWLVPSANRAAIFHSVLLEYMAFLQRRGFLVFRLWACPPMTGDDYAFHCHPAETWTKKVPGFKPPTRVLVNWYDKLLDEATDLTRLYSYNWGTTSQLLAMSLGVDAVERINPLQFPVYKGGLWPQLLHAAVPLEERRLAAMKTRELKKRTKASAHRRERRVSKTTRSGAAGTAPPLPFLLANQQAAKSSSEGSNGGSGNGSGGSGAGGDASSGKVALPARSGMGAIIAESLGGGGDEVARAAVARAFADLIDPQEASTHFTAELTPVCAACGERSCNEGFVRRRMRRGRGSGCPVVGPSHLVRCAWCFASSVALRDPTTATAAAAAATAALAAEGTRGADPPNVWHAVPWRSFADRTDPVGEPECVGSTRLQTREELLWLQQTNGLQFHRLLHARQASASLVWTAAGMPVAAKQLSSLEGRRKKAKNSGGGPRSSPRRRRGLM